MQVIDVYNNKLHTVTEQKSINLINTKNENLINIVIEKIKNFVREIK